MGRKLKRFLLSYDPPGIGLEVQQEDGELEIVHKDMPPAQQIHGVEDILCAVDQMIEEDDMLTRKRHRPALIQLLGRLYQVDVSEADTAGDEAFKEDHPASPINESQKGGRSAKGDSASNPLAALLQEGSPVVLTGLDGKDAVHNGEQGTVTKYRPEKNKFEVTMSSSKQEVKVKGIEHLILSAPKGTGLAVGTPVVIRGLRNHTELNGCLGRVVECHEETHRFEVRATESAQLFRVKQENLVPVDNNFIPPLTGKVGGGGSTWHEGGGGGIGGIGEDDVLEVGSIVELQGLKTAMSYNGQTAEVLSVDRARGRYEIRLGDGSVKTIRAENVRLISKVQKQSPRLRKKEAPTKQK